ncbi:MAG: enolase C-terminal domain-like protein [Pseudomonadota bacterium]
MKIHSVRVQAVKVPITEPHRTASGVVEICPLVLISVEISGGITGNGIVFCYMDRFLKPLYELSCQLGPFLENQSLDPAANTDMLVDRFKLIGTQGLMGMVLGGLDMALWDAKARAENSALHTLLGKQARPVKPYGNVGYDGVRDTAEAAGRLAEQGFLGVKAKIGYPTVEEDLETIRAMRDAVGPNVALMVDYNQSLPFPEAVVRLEALENEGLTWIEEPIHSHDFTNYVRLQQETGAPVQAGENWWGPLDFQIAFDAGVRGRIMPDGQKCLGVTGWMRIAERADELNIEVSSHLWPEVSAQLLSVTPTGGWLEYMDWFNPILKEPLRLKDGFADIEGVIGTGVEFDPDAIKRFIAD